MDAVASCRPIAHLLAVADARGDRADKALDGVQVHEAFGAAAPQDRMKRGRRVDRAIAYLLPSINTHGIRLDKLAGVQIHEACSAAAPEQGMIVAAQHRGG